MPDATAEFADTLVAPPRGDLLAEEARLAPAAAQVGRSSARRIAGIVGQYAMLVALAALVVIPLAFSLIQALSPPFTYFDQGKPLHPVAVDWKDRTWFTGGAFSVLVRTLVVVAALAWLQLRAAGGRVADLAPLAAPRRLAAVAAGTVATMLLATATWGALHDRAATTAWWWLAGIAAVAGTQLAGFADRWRGWRGVVAAFFAGGAIFTMVVVAFGAAVWNQGWDRGELGPAMTRSLTVAALITVAQVVTSVLAAYAFAFLRFPFKTVVFAFFMATMLLPLEVTLLGNVQTIRELGWINSNAGLVLPFAATAFGTFLIRQGFRGLPPEIHDATRLDGYGHFQFLWRFAVPLTRPVIAAFVVISALGAWNQYLWPQAIIDDERYQTAQIRLRTVTGVDITDANIGIAAALIVALPVVLLLIAFSRQIIRGITAGAVKG
jgi:sn-glycerol 3-phosphate transport system permease protein